MPYSARPSSFIRLRISGVTPGKMRLLDISPRLRCSVALIFGPRRSGTRIPALQVDEEAVDRAHRGTDEFGRVSADPSHQKPRAAWGEENSAGKQKRRPGDSRHDEADYPGGNQQPAGPSRQLLHREDRLFGHHRYVGRPGWPDISGTARQSSAARSSERRRGIGLQLAALDHLYEPGSELRILAV